MKVRIFNRNKGWYVPCSNWQDKEDKVYMNVRFAHRDDPIPDNVAIENAGYCFTDIDVQEAKFECYQKKISMTVFRYEPITNGEVKGYENIRLHDVPTTIDDGDFPWE